VSRLLYGIRETLADLLPRLTDRALYSEETYTVERTIRDYLPTTLESYMRLPAGFAETHALTQGKTARILLVEQLGILDNHLKKLLKNAVEKDARALVENGRFLAEKFKSCDFFNLGEDS